jgi:hypothetical protein
MAENYFEIINEVRGKLEAIEEASRLFDEDVVSRLEALAQIDISLIAQDLAKGHYLGNRKLDIDLSLNQVGDTAVKYESARIVTDSGIVLDIAFSSGETESPSIIREQITDAIATYNDGVVDENDKIIDFEYDMLNENNDDPVIIQFRDQDGKSTSLDRVELVVWSGGATNALNNRPTYTWADTTSSMMTIANRIAGVAKLADSIDKIKTLISRIDEVLAIQEKTPELIDNEDSLYNLRDKLVSLYDVIDEIVALEAIKGYISTLANTTYKGQIETLADATYKAKVESVASNMEDINNAEENATIASQKAQEATDRADEIKAVTVGAINTLSAGQLASVTYDPNTGKFYFYIPQGAKGDRGEAFAVNAIGLIAERSNYDAQPINFSFFATDTGEIYFKQSNDNGDWSAGIPFGKGDTGNGIESIEKTSTTDNVDTYTITYTDTTTSTFTVTNGASAYEVAVANGFVGTEAEWLASLQATGATTIDAMTDTDTDDKTGKDGYVLTWDETSSKYILSEFTLPQYNINFGTVPTSLYEGMSTTLTDASYTSGVTYLVENVVGCSIVNNLDGTFTLTTTIADATVATFTITASKSGYTDGEYNGSITLTQVVLDGAVGIFNPSSSMGDLDTTFTTLSNITFSNEKAVVGDGTAEMISTTIDMGENGAIATDSYIRVEANNIAVTDDLDVSKIVSTKDISNQSALIVWDNGGSEEVLEVDVGVMADAEFDLTLSTDPFSDGSLIYKHNMDSTSTLVGSSTYPNGNPSFVAGKFGNAVDFNGSVSNTTAPYINTGVLSSSAKTISMWVTKTNGVSSGRYIGSASSTDTPLHWTTDGTNLMIYHNLWSHTIDVSDLPDGKFFHIVSVQNSSNTTIYINGVKSGSIGSSRTDGIHQSLALGGIRSDYIDCVEKVDQVEFYNRPLTAEDVSTLYTQQGTKYTYTEADNTKALYGKTPLALFENNTRNLAITFDDGTNYTDVETAPIYEGSNIIKFKQTLPDGSGIQPTAGNLFKAKITNSNKDEKIIEAYTKVYEEA